MTQPTTKIQPVNPDESALLIMDFQPVVLDAMADGADLLERANAAIAVARERGIRIVFVRVAFAIDDYGNVPATNKPFAAVAAAGYLADDSPSTALHPDLDVRDEDIVVRKVRVGAFGTTKLDRTLTNLGITTLVLAGVHTTGVILSTVRDGADLDYRLLLLTECISDPDRDVHDVLMIKVLSRQAELVTIAEFADLARNG